MPQGSPLSPLLRTSCWTSSIESSTRRGHRFARYADDCNVYVRSEQAGRRVMASLTKFIQGRLRLKVNQDKSAVARPGGSPFPRVPVAVRPAVRGRGGSALGAHQAQRHGARSGSSRRDSGAARLAWLHPADQRVAGRVASASSGSPPSRDAVMRAIDAHIRRRLRAIILHHWRRKRTIAKQPRHARCQPAAVWHQIYQGRRPGGR